MTIATLVSIISRVITSQQFFLYNSITFISISIASIPVPAIHIPTINISNNQYTIPAIKAFGIFVLICAAECPASIVHPTGVDHFFFRSVITDSPGFLVFHHIPIEICGSGDNRFPFTSSDYFDCVMKNRHIWIPPFCTSGIDFRQHCFRF